VSKITGFTTPM